MNFTKLYELVENNNTFILTVHINPDADAIGSQVALGKWLQHLGKDVRMINHSETPDSLLFLDEHKDVLQYNREEHDTLIGNADVIVFLDLNVASRVASMQPACLNSKAKKVIIDHHTNPEDFADLSYVFTEYSSTGEIVYDIIKNSDHNKITLEIASALYAAIMTDTGSFHYDRTTPKVHQIAAELLQIGVSPDKIYEEVYETGTLSRLKLLGYALTSMQQNATGEIIYMIITKEDLQRTRTIESDIESFVGYTLSVRGSKIGLLFYELEDGIKVSFRSKGKIPVNKLAEEFGGGGHLNAAGARIAKGKLSSYLEKIITRAEDYLKYF